MLEICRSPKEGGIDFEKVNLSWFTGKFELLFRFLRVNRVSLAKKH